MSRKLLALVVFYIHRADQGGVPKSHKSPGPHGLGKRVHKYIIAAMDLRKLAYDAQRKSWVDHIAWKVVARAGKSH